MASRSLCVNVTSAKNRVWTKCNAVGGGGADGGVYHAEEAEKSLGRKRDFSV